jgi:D-3-phosphoglycerate dehydrogenase / 2-oxoglutarate reductase
MTGSRCVVVVDYAWGDLEIEQEVLAAGEAVVVPAMTGQEAELLELLPGADAIMVNWAPLRRPALAAAERCVTVARYGVGVDNIDVAAATELGMVVSRVPDYCADEVAEHTVALLLALGRHVVDFASQTRAGGWDNGAFGPMRRVRGSTLGIVGWGAIGRAVADRAVGLGMAVRVFSRSLSGQRLPAGVTPSGSLLELAAAVDYLSVHVPLTEATRDLVDESVLRAMRPHAFVINTARGPVVDADALAVAVRDGWIAGAALDVLDADPPSPGHPLIGLERVVLTPHAAFNSVEALATLRREAAENVLAVLTGNVPRHLANPEVLGASGLRMGTAASRT